MSLPNCRTKLLVRATRCDVSDRRSEEATEKDAMVEQDDHRCRRQLKHIGDD
jgi:hypothetical protein